MTRTPKRFAAIAGFAVLLLSCSVRAAERPADSTSLAYSNLRRDIESVHPDWKAGMRVANFSLRRDRGTFILQEGLAVQCLDIAGGRHAVAFRGKGTFVMSFPDDVERQQYRRFMERDSAVIPITQLFLFFSDSTMEEFSRSNRFREFNPGWDDSALVTIARRPAIYILRDDAILFGLLQKERNGGFFAFFTDDNADNFFFRVNPSDREEVSFGRENTNLLHRTIETINQFHAGGAPGAEHPLIKITDYAIESTIRSNLDYSAEARVTFRANRPGLHWIPMYLFEDLKVDSIFWKSGARGEFVRVEEQSTLWIRSQVAPTPGDSCVLRIAYHGDLLARNGLEWIGIKSPDGWFPRDGHRTRAKFDLTYHYPSKYRLASVGKRAGFLEGDDVSTSRWITPAAIRNASFNIGLFQEYQINEKELPPVTIYMSEMGHRKALEMDENVGADVAGSLSFFTRLFGRTGIEQFYATEIPYGHGEAFPGLIHLSWVTFSGNDHKGFHEVFRAHEVAHQWWGIGVDFDSYHDQWLSEAFAEYSGLWYLQAVMKENDEFFDMLDMYRESILTNRKYLIGKGQESGPISLGYRTSSSETEGDYDLIIYRKGAWVVHMLRQMLLDLNTMNEDRFHSLMGDYYQEFKGKRVSTGDFAAFASAHFGKDMGWFFHEWIDLTEIPSYRFAYRVSETADGHYRVTCRVVQEGVPPEFTMPIPLKLQFAGDRFARLRIVAKGPVTEVELPPLPLKPEEILFNDLHSVLCTFKAVDWE